MTATYRNPWHDPARAWYGPEFYVTDVKPIEYRGFQIFQRVPKSWELVKDGLCLTQRRGVPRPTVDALYGAAGIEDDWSLDRIRGIAARWGVTLPPPY